MKPSKPEESGSLAHTLHNSRQGLTAALLGMEMLLREVKADPNSPSYIADKLLPLVDTLRQSSNELHELSQDLEDPDHSLH